MKKIYITALHMRHGGIEMAISLLSNAFAKRGYEVNILSIYNLGEPAYKLEPSVKIHYLTNVAPNRDAFIQAKKEHAFFKMLKEGIYSLKVLYLKEKSMKDALKSIQEGVVISTRNEHSVLLSKYGRKNVFKIAQLHHDHEFKENLIKDFKNNYQNIDIFALLTDDLRDEVESFIKGHNSHTKCVTIPNFLENVKCDVELHEKQKTVITVGRLHPVKGFERLIKSWKLVSEKKPEWKLKIVGGGELESSLQSTINELDLADKIEMTGALDHNDVMLEMKKASFYVMTSYSEAFPFVLIEAMSNALPVVAFDVRVGPRAIVDHTKNGFLVKDDDLEAFAKSVRELIENEDKRETMSMCAFEKAQCFTEERVMEMWISIIEDKM